ncbi:MAG: glycogen debranching enzyme GlgX [Planctomycetia bacterium]|nr:glycogen debranching enzyme GlgX [Planctomycetia bacterium]
MACCDRHRSAINLRRCIMSAMAKTRLPSSRRLHAQQTLPPLQFNFPLPYGAILQSAGPDTVGGVQFVVYSRSATAMRVLLYDSVDAPEPSEVIALDPEQDRWGDIWSIFVPGIGHGQLYHFQADGPFDPERGQRFDGSARLIDPYSKALAGHYLPGSDGIVRPPKSVVVDESFDWQGDRHLRRGLADTVIYEMHVRGFTQSPTSGAKHPGTYLGVIEKIPYLQSLGVTAVELMPVHEFPTEAADGVRGERSNYWGYDPMAFFAPHRGYAAGSEPGCQVREFKEMVRALHAAGIEVILDVVFNHTAEGNELGPTFSFKGLENRVYYMLGDGGSSYRNYSGCGNTINGNHPIVRELIFLCLRHWVHNYHVDGFRFDLASILSRDRNGDIVANPPIVEVITEDPMLADTKIIAEAWDAAGAYQVGSFASLRWAEWNGHYRDDVRRYWRGDYAQTGHLATRLAGSSDLYGDNGRQPYHSINFITSHDGFTMNDLVSFREKHNEANGEGNRDGDNNNFSDNYGVEGSTRQVAINRFRARQIRNLLATLLLSQGVPMLVAGDECRRTQKGNNNAYCQDNTLSWFDWSLVDEHAELVRFVRQLISFRLGNPTLRRRNFLRGGSSAAGVLPDVEWFSPEGSHVDWYAADASLVCFFGAPDQQRLLIEDDPSAGGTEGKPQHVLLFSHAGSEPRTFQFPVPEALRSLPWRSFIDTAAAPPNDIASCPGKLIDVTQPLDLTDHSLLCLVADARPAVRRRIGQSRP